MEDGNVKEFLGITQNACTFQGKVVGQPYFQGEGFAMITLRTSVAELAANGSWVDNTINVPIMTTDAKKVAVISKLVNDGRELLIETYYKSWQNQGQAQHGFFIKRLVLGRKKYEPKPQTQAPPLT